MVDIIKIKEWVEALESGDYEQTSGNLKDDKGYCCIGVLGAINNVQVFSDGEMSIDAYEICKGITGKRATSLFWTMNDEKGMTFKEIAGEIRRMYNID